MKKRFLSMVLSAVLLLTSLPVFCFFANAVVSPYKVGDTVTLGSYPQTEVTDSTLIKSLNAIESGWKAFPYYAGDGSMGSMTQQEYTYYKDVTLDGVKYRAVRFTKFRPSTVYDSFYDGGYSNQEANGFEESKIYWFSFDPIEWIVLDPENGLLISKNVLDSQPFSNTVYELETLEDEYDYWYSYSYSYYSDSAFTKELNRYDTSSIRTWLNKTFYDTAFTSKQKSYIIEQTIETSPYGDNIGNTYLTKDKVYLLSAGDTQNTAYYKTSYWGYSYSSLDDAYATSYALSQGASSWADWLTRTPANRTNEIYCYNYYLSTAYGYSTTYGIRPVINVNFGEQTAGDIDGDGAITSADARYALRISVGLAYASDEILFYADADGSGDVTAADARLILRYSVGLETGEDFSHFFTPQITATEDIPYANKHLVQTINLTEGESISLGDNHIKRKNVSYKWASSNTAAATVSSDGTVKAKKKGFACVYLTTGSSRYYYYINVISSLQKKIYALQDKYPSGYYWNAYKKSSQYPAVTETPCTDHSSGKFQYCIGQCAGFAHLLSNEVFGKNAPVYRNLSVKDIKIGDYVRCLPNHSVFVIDKVSKGEIIDYDIYYDENYTAYCDMITVAECNWDRQCGIAWGRRIELDSISIDSYETYSRYK